MTTTKLETSQSNSDNKQIALFLDIDGPVIDLATYNKSPHISYFRVEGNKRAIKNVTKLCVEFDLTIVTNSTHNYYNVYNADLRDDLVRWGIPENCFHDDWRSVFPNVDYKKIQSTVRGIGRLYAINEWLCFDDRKFTDDNRLIHITRLDGVDDLYYKQAADVIATMRGN
jgi:hypothetical protein